MAYHLKNKPEEWMKNTRVLAIDQGTKTLGLALSNSDQTIATPLETIFRKKWLSDKQALTNIICDYDVGIIILGYPLNMDGRAGARCQSVRDFATLIEQEWPQIPVFFWDERLSTHAADNLLTQHTHMKKTKHKQVRDAMAAQIILEEALSFLQKGAPN